MQRDSIPKLPFEFDVSGLGVILYSEWPRICEKQVFYHERIEKGWSKILREIPEKEVLFRDFRAPPLIQEKFEIRDNNVGKIFLHLYKG